jgi:hypothetical protein
MEVETSWLIDELLFPGDDDRNDEVRARGCLRECSIEHDGTDDRERVCKEVAARLQITADKIDKGNPEIISRAAEVLVAFVTDSSTEEYQKFEEVARKAIRLADPDTSTELSGFATMYRIGKLTLTKLGLDSPFRRVAGECVKKVLNSWVGTVVAKNEKGEWVSCRNKYGSIVIAAVGVLPVLGLIERHGSA